MKMYTGAEASKETQHITPHIAAHKSSLAPTSSVSTFSSVGLTDSGTPHALAQPHLANKSGVNTHIPTYKVGMHPPNHSIVKSLDHGGPMYLARHGHAGQSSHSAHHSKSTPQDLSAHAPAGTDKTAPIELTPNSSSHHKPLPHIHTVVSQSVSGNQLGTLIPAHQTDRGSYYRMPESVISVQGPSAVLVSTGEGGVSSNPHASHSTNMVHAQSSLPAHSSTTNLTTMPPASLAATVAVPGGLNPISTVSMCHNHAMPSECIAGPNVAPGCGIQQLDLRGVKKEKVDQLEGMGLPGGSQQVAGPQRDLVRQALQAVVTNPQHKTGNDQEVIEYNYTAGDIAELLMMNIQVNASLQAMNKSNVPAETGGGQVVLLQPAAVDDTTSLAQQPLTPKRRRPKLSEEAQVERRVRIAMRMREKRATESDEQRVIRRQKEAERMRRKRATEDNETKRLRRLEAAARARNRRASMSFEERIVDRQRAAERMRVRRATESPDTKSVRRLKAAERMRKRRASETPEQRTKRRQVIALKMKARRKGKGEDGINGDEPEIITRTITTRLGKANSLSNNVTHSGSSEPVTTVNPGNASHLVSSSSSSSSASSSHIFVPSTSSGGGSISVLQVDTSVPQMVVPVSHPSGLSTVDMTQLPQPLSLQKSSSNQKQEMPEPLSLQKQEVASQQSSPAATPTPESSVGLSSLSASHSLEPLPLHKTASYHHHLPHLLHYHQPPHTTSQQPHQQAPHHHLHHHHHHHSHHHLQHRHHHQ